jgi:hypothetical protein
VGFLEAADGYRQGSTSLRRHIRTPALAKLGLREFEPHASYESYWGSTASGNRDAAHRRRWDFENGYRSRRRRSTFSTRGCAKPFEVYPGVVVPAGTIGVHIFSNRASPIGASGFLAVQRRTSAASCRAAR